MKAHSFIGNSLGRRWALAVLVVAMLAPASAMAQATYTVLWFDNTPTYGSQAPDALRQEMCDYLTNVGGGGIFDCTYLSAGGGGSFAAHMASNAYDVIVFDSTPGSFNASDRTAIATHWRSHPAILLDGTLYIRSINYNAGTNFPGPSGSTGALTANQVYQLATRGGGFMVGTDHQGFQAGANYILQGVLPAAAFSGITYPSVDGLFHGDDLIDAIEVVNVGGLFSHWDTVPTEGIAPTGTFTDVDGGTVTLYSQVDVANDPGGGPKYSYISTSWEPGGLGQEFDCNDNGVLDSLDIERGTSQDVDGNQVPDECDPDCNENGLPDGKDIQDGTDFDCNDNDVLDSCDIRDGTSQDANGNDVPDECEEGECEDVDGDGYGDPGSVDCPNGPAEDCDDGDRTVNPGADEDCDNGIDDDCDGLVDLEDVDDCEDLYVSLLSFEAFPADGQVTLLWETELEIDNAGFYLLRRDALNGRTARINPGLVPAQGDVFMGASYRFVDTEAVNGLEVDYVLVDVELGGLETQHEAVRTVANPQSPAIELVSPAYGHDLAPGQGLTLSWRSANNGRRAVVSLSADPTFSDGSAVSLNVSSKRMKGDLRSLRLSAGQLTRLSGLAEAGGGVLYWKVVEHTLGSQRFESAISRLDLVGLSPAASDEEEPRVRTRDIVAGPSFIRR
jgi:hypothetical protein